MTDPPPIERVPEPPPEPPSPVLPAPEKYPVWGYRDLLLLAGMVIPIALLTHLAVFLFFFFLNWTPRARAVGPIIETFIISGLWLIAASWLIRIQYRRPFWRAIGWLRGNWTFAACLGWGVVLALVCVGLGIVLHPPKVRTQLEDLLQDRLSLVLAGTYAVTLAPVFEEIAFRGLLMPLLIRSFGVVPGILLQALPFAALHGAEYSWQWQLLAIIFVAGSAFGWMRYRAGSVAASAYMHAGYNLVFFGLMLMQRFVAHGRP